MNEGQDPASLEARVAFHLHRLKLVGRPLQTAGHNKDDAADLAAARQLLTPSQIIALARALTIDTSELSRELSGDEARQWSFYRASATNPHHVWNRARSSWRAANFTDQQAANILGINTSIIRRACTQPGQRIVLSFERAARLTTALNITEGPEAFLPSPKPHDPQTSR